MPEAFDWRAHPEQVLATLAFAILPDAQHTPDSVTAFVMGAHVALELIDTAPVSATLLNRKLAAHWPDTMRPQVIALLRELFLSNAAASAWRADRADRADREE